MKTISETELIKSNRIYAIVGDYTKMGPDFIRKVFVNARYLLFCFRGMPDLSLHSSFFTLASIRTTTQLVLICNTREARHYPLAAQAALDFLIDKADYVLDLTWSSHDLPLAAAQYSDQTFMLGTEICSTLSPLLQINDYTGTVVLLP